EHTVFEAEVTGIILALDIIKSTPRLTSADIFMDCQPAITASASPKSQPGQHLLTIFHTELRRLRTARTTLCLRIHWVPAHVRIAGNKEVDACTKDDARGANTPFTLCLRGLDPPLPQSRAATIAAGAHAFRARW
ncbi:hypothetical protein B0H17DRAFT_864342, partial [Mycena rosella]